MNLQILVKTALVLIWILTLLLVGMATWNFELQDSLSMAMRYEFYGVLLVKFVAVSMALFFVYHAHTADKEGRSETVKKSKNTAFHKCSDLAQIY